jgi:hypothetical protein
MVGYSVDLLAAEWVELMVAMRAATMVGMTVALKAETMAVLLADQSVAKKAEKRGY